MSNWGLLDYDSSPTDACDNLTYVYCVDNENTW